MTIKPLSDKAEVFNSINKLPTLPSIFDQLYHMVKDPEISVNRVSSVISSDPAISARILRLVNSAYYGLSGKVKTVKHAIVILGFNTIRNLVLSLSVFGMFRGESNAVLFNKAKFWRHSIRCGVISQFIAEKTMLYEVGEAFTGGILHDIGKLLLEQYLGEEYNEAFKLQRDENIPLNLAEERLWGLDHTMVGEFLREGWNIPEGIVNAVSFHHHPDRTPDNKNLIYIVHLSNALAKEITAKEENSNITELPVNEETWDVLSLSPERVMDWLDEIIDKNIQSEEFIKIAEEELKGS